MVKRSVGRPARVIGGGKEGRMADAARQHFDYATREKNYGGLFLGFARSLAAKQLHTGRPRAAFCCMHASELNKSRIAPRQLSASRLLLLLLHAHLRIGL